MRRQLRVVVIATCIGLVAIPFAVSAPQGQGDGAAGNRADKVQGKQQGKGARRRVTASNSSTFPDGISPSDVYARMDLLDRCLDALLKHRNISIGSQEYPNQVESELQPMHVYQTVLICTWRLQQLDDLFGVKHIPTISSDPRKYDPRDVHFIADLMVDNVAQIGKRLQVELPVMEKQFNDKAPTDVFNLAVRVFIKLNRLSNNMTLDPSEVYSQMVRGVEDVKSMLRQQDPACRYNIRGPATEDNREPSDVFAKCLEIRAQINRIRKAFGLKVVAIPQLPRNTVSPRDVFFQTQIIIAEMNLLKLQLDTKSSSPLPIPVKKKTPTDVHKQATMILHLLKQVKLRSRSVASGKGVKILLL